MKTIILFNIVLVLLSMGPASASCLKLDQDKTTINWEAYKTMAKAGVKGQLKEYVFSSKTQGASIKEIISNSKLKISGPSVFTKNSARDKKIAKHFFRNAKNNGEIQVNIKKVKKNKLITMITMNGTTKEVPLTYKLDGNTLNANGHIDILDFAMSKSLKALNKACYALHEGKTWSHVSIGISANFIPCQ